MKNLVLFGNQNLQNAEITVSSTTSRNNPAQNIQETELARLAGSIITDTKTRSKIISLNGQIQKPSTSEQTLYDILERIDREINRENRFLRFMRNYIEIEECDDQTDWSGSNGVENFSLDQDIFQYKDSSIKFDIDVSDSALIAQTDFVFGNNIQVNSANSPEIKMVYDTSNDKVVIIYRDPNNSFYGTAKVGTVSDSTITWGSSVAFTSISVGNLGITFDSTNNKIIVGYETTGGLYAIVGTVSGTSISFGTPTNVTSNAVRKIEMAFDNNNSKILFTYIDDVDTDTFKRTSGTVSGTSISFGTIIGTFSNCFDLAVDWDDNVQRGAVIARNSSNLVRVFNLQYSSGTDTYTIVASSDISTDGSIYVDITFDNNQNKFLATYLTNSQLDLTAQSITLTSTTINVGTAKTVLTTNLEGLTRFSVTFDSARNVFVCLIRDYAATGQNLDVFVMEIDNNIVLNYSPTTYRENISTIGANVEVIFDPDSIKFVLAHSTTGTVDELLSVVASLISKYESSLIGTVDTIDLSNEEETGSFGFWVYFPSATDLQGIILKIGNDSSNYYRSEVLTTNYENISLFGGWNFFVVEWSQMQKVGTVDTNVIDYIEINIQYNQNVSDYVGCRIDGILWNDENETRNYKAYQRNFNKIDEHWNVLMTQYDLSLLCYEGTAFATFTEEIFDENVTSDPNRQNFFANGSFTGDLLFTIDINSETAMTNLSITNQVTNEIISIDSSYQPGDQLIIDIANQIVQKNGSDIDFDGRLTFNVIENSELELNITDTGAFDIDWKLDFRRRYLS